LLISRIGNDERGQLVERAMLEWGMDPAGVEVDSNYPTGVVDVRFEDGEHSFDILSDQAYDHISQNQLEHSQTREAALLYHGTLIMRETRSRELLSTLQRQTSIPRFIDLNLRSPWWLPEQLVDYVKGATWVKVNESELETVARQLGCHSNDPKDSAEATRRKLGLQLLIVTMGGQGAFVTSSTENSASVVPESVEKVIDTVGAGDAFAAVAILGLIFEWPLKTTLERAQRFASEIVQLRGATSRDPDMYQRIAEEWAE
jgi:fructokinase